MKRPRLLVFGARGQLAQELRRLSGDQGYEVRLLGRHELDLLDPLADIAGAVARMKPAFVINAAGYTAVDRAEDEPDAALRLNCSAPAEMARACAVVGAPFINISTDYVFAGDGGAPYREGDPPRPLGVYGDTKARGESAVAAAGGAAVSLRTSWVYASHGANFVRTMLRLASTRDEIPVVADQRARPTWARDLARACLAARASLSAGRLQGQPVVHVAGDGEASWADFANEIFALSRARGGPHATVRPITTAEFPTRARRPGDSRLETRLAVERLEWRPSQWRESLSKVMDEIQAEGFPVVGGAP